MVSNVVQLGLTIHAIRIDNKKITPALFQQFDEGCLLHDIEWCGVEMDNEIPFTILGRYSHKNKDIHDQIPFIYYVENELKTSTVRTFQVNSNRRLESIQSEILDEIQELCEFISITDPIDLLSRLAKGSHLPGEFSWNSPFYEFKPKFSDFNITNIALNPIHVKTLTDYREAKSVLKVIYSDFTDNSEDIQKRIDQLHEVIVQSKLHLLIQQWFSANEDVLRDELSLASSYYDRCKQYIDALQNKIISSQKLYIGV